MRILAVEPIGCHKSLNKFFLRCFGSIGHVTFAAPAEFLKSYPVDSRIDIPESLFQHKTKAGARWSAIRVLSFILRNISLDDYDAIVFMSYETISFSVRWPRGRRTFVFEHNNIENARGSRVKTFFYKHLSSRIVHMVFQHHIVPFIHDTYGRRTVYIPFPNTRGDVSNSGAHVEAKARAEEVGGKRIIFSPSGSTPRFIQDELKRFASMTEGAYYVICKGEVAQRGDAWEVCPFFENYEDLMRDCGLVFFGALFNCHASSVVYEALSYGKPVALFDCAFAREVHEECPSMVFVISKVSDILRLETDPEKMRKDHSDFLRRHSFDTVRAIMEPLLLS